MTDGQLVKLKDLIANCKTDLFYQWGEWLALRSDVLRLDNRECQLCKEKGKMSRAEIVHHVKRLKERPDLSIKRCKRKFVDRRL